MGANAARGISVAEINRRSSEASEIAMIKRAVCVFGVTLAVLVACGQLSAHHGSSNYDLSKSVSVKGTVTQFEFINPH